MPATPLATSDLRRSPRLAAGTAPAALLDHLDLIERLARATCARGGWTGVDVDDFVSWTKLRLIDDDYAILRKHRGESSLPTYLHSVIRHLFLDYRNSTCGKWRHSAFAVRSGREAVRLETLIYRDGFTPAEAVEMVTSHYRTRMNRGELEELAARLPCRPRRRAVPAEALESLPGNPRQPDPGEERLALPDRRAMGVRIRRAFLAAFARLSSHERRILRLHYFEGRTLAEIARRLELDSRRIYRHHERCLGRLRRELAGRGIAWREIETVLGCRETELELVLDERSPETPAPPRLVPPSRALDSPRAAAAC